MNDVHTYPKMNETVKDLLRRSDEPMMQYILARIEELEKQVAEYTATGVTPEEIGELIGCMRGVCLLCCNQIDEATPDKPKVNGCIHTDCECHKWRAKWYKEAADDRH